MTTPPAARDLAVWASNLRPTDADVELADRAVLDSLAVAVAARDEPILEIARELGEAGRWATATHILDFDDLHMPSTTHISTVCVPVVLAGGGAAKDYLVGAGVMARLGAVLGWRHYTAGWHATTTAGALAAAACGASILGLDEEQFAVALALAVPASGGVQKAFGTDAKSLQVGFAADAGWRAARLAAAGASADVGAVDAWMDLLNPDHAALSHLGTDAPAVPDGLAVKIHPCCYALQRPISTVAPLRTQLDVGDVERIVVRSLAAAVAPLHHHRPTTGLEGKFSLEYAVAAALLDEHVGFASFTDEAVERPEARALVELVEVDLEPGGDGLLDGATAVEVSLRGGRTLESHLDLPPGAPQMPPTSAQMAGKVADCLAGTDLTPDVLTWTDGAALMRELFGRAH